MNFKHTVIGLLVLAVVAGCDGPKTREIEGVPSEPAAPPIATPPPSTPRPTPTPAATPATTPPTATRKLPEGTLFLRKGISITHADGIRRIVPGTVVTVISMTGDKVVAQTDDGTQLEAPVTSFGSDLDELDNIHASKSANARVMAEKAATAKVLEQQRKT